jgi:hypothetical protein
MGDVVELVVTIIATLAGGCLGLLAYLVVAKRERQ